MGRARKKKRGKSPQGGITGRFARLLGGVFLGSSSGEAQDDRWQEIKGIALIALALWLAVSMASFHAPIDARGAEGHNWGGQLGFYFADWSFSVFGLAGYLMALLGVCWGGILVARKRVHWASVRLLGAVCFAISISFLLELGSETDVNSPQLPYGPGGFLATEAVPKLQVKVGVFGLWLLMGSLAVVSFMVATETAFYPAVRALREWGQEAREVHGQRLGRAVGRWILDLLRGLWDFVRGEGLSEEPAPRTSRRAAPRAEEEAEAEDEEEDAEDEDEWEYEYEDEEEEEDDDGDDEDLAEAEVKPAPRRKAPRGSLVKPLAQSLPFEPVTPPAGEWKLPSPDLLLAPDRALEAEETSIEAAAHKLEGSLASFRVEAQVVGAQVGPTVTLYELEVAQGTRMNKVTQLSQEIAAALRAQSVRVIAPIPGKSTIGIEVPNDKRRLVRLSELVSKKAYDKKFAALPIFLGVDAEGRAIVEDLTRMPHLLIAGTTGSGKSVCVNSILASMLLTRSPHDVQMILIDPKMVELQAFAKIPHLMLPVVTNMHEATNVLMWAVEKMEGRYELFKGVGVRNIKAYNALSEDELRERLGDDFNEERTPRHVPYVLIVIDELADLMMLAKKEAEHAVTRLAQKSRAVGIHVILATQRPSTDVITGVIKGNLPTRIAFQVASKVDSRVILDVMGADKLLGGGDMLYSPPQSSRILRVQGALVEDAELQAVIDFVCQESVPSFSQEMVQVATGARTEGSGLEAARQDPAWDEAVRVILKSKRGSASLLQRALGVGYTRASRLLDMMTEAGIVGAHKGSKAREVLLTLEDWEEMDGAPMEQGVGDE